MSYDLAVWEGPPPGSDEEGAAEYERRMDEMERLLDAGDETPDPTPGIRAFVSAALERYPELDEDSGPECPWASAPLLGEAMGELIYFPMTFSGAAYARDVVAGIAHDHGLVCFDPQIERLLPAADALSASVIEDQVMTAVQQHLDAEAATKRGGWWSRLFGRG